jgi:hypothetical protein
VSRYDLFRRRLAPIAFFLVIALIAKDSCDKQRRTHTTVELALGDDRPSIRAVDVDVVVEGQTVTTYHRAAMPGSTIGPCLFQLSSPSDDGELRIDLDLGASHRQLTRRFHAVEGAKIVVPVGDPR